MTRKKGKRPILKLYDAQKAKRLSHQSEISKISGIDLTMRCVDSKRSNDMLNVEPNEKLQRIVLKYMWEVIYAYFYN